MPTIPIRGTDAPVKALSGPARWRAYRLGVMADDLERDLLAVSVLGHVWAYSPPMPTKDRGQRAQEYGRAVSERLEAAGYSVTEIVTAAWTFLAPIIEEHRPPTVEEVEEARGNSPESPPSATDSA